MRSLTRRHVFALPLALAATAGPAGAQAPAERLLTPSARLGEPFTRVRGLRELSDGRVLVSDQTEKGVFLSDFVAETRTMLARNGPGPEEYATPIRLFAVHGDTSLLVDLGNMRLATFAPDGRITATRPLLDSPGASIPTASDSAGRLYWDLATGVRLRKREQPGADQAEIIRWNRGTIDTVAHVTIPGGVNPGPFPDYDYWAVSAEGRIAIARNSAEYRLDWVEPDGRTTRGETVRAEPVRTNASDRDIFAKPRDQGGYGGGTGGGVRMGSNAAPPPPPRDALPDRLPWVKYDGVWIASDGRAWVERLQHLAEKRALLDVFDPSGRLVARFRLPDARQVVGFGNGTLYAVHVDEVGLQWLEKYPVPG